MESNKFINQGQNILDKMEKISFSAQNELKNKQPDLSNSLAQINTLNTDMSKCSLLAEQKNSGLKKAKDRPCFMRVVLSSDNKEEQKEFFFTESNYTPFVPGVNLVSNKARIGILMSKDVGEDFEWQNKTYYVCEKDSFTPQKNEKWDGLKFSFCEKGENPEKGDSLLNALSRLKHFSKEVDVKNNNIWDNIEYYDKSNYLESDGLNERDAFELNIRKSISLRSHPLLDKIQENIYRHPLNKRISLMGPAGTGKTTTLMRRLSQKLFIEHLDDDEKSVVENDNEYQNSWIMFTPTDLLVEYLKDSANKEEIINRSNNIKTWDNYSYNIARNVLPILRKDTGNNGFLLKKNISNLSDDFFTHLDDFFEDFLLWQEYKFTDEVKDALRIVASYLENSQDNFIKRVNTKNIYTIIFSIKKIYNLKEEEQASLEKDIINKISKILRSNKKIITTDDRNLFLDSLRKFGESLQKEGEELLDNDDDLIEDEAEHEEKTIYLAPQEILKRFFYKPIEGYSRSLANSRKPSERNKSFKDFFEKQGYIFDDGELKEIGKLSNIKRAFTKITSLDTKYQRGISKRYKKFRLQNEFSKYYTKNFDKTSNVVSQDEVDILIYAYLYMLEEFITKNVDIADNSYLYQLKKEFRYQIYVDEVTDFSPVQVACMYRLSKQPFRSFFACGDFNQRLSYNGCSTKQGLSWAVPEIEFIEISVNYRQSRKLHAFANKLASVSYNLKDEESSDIIEGVAPVWLNSASDYKTIACWLRDRILEIQNQIKILPSIAVFVNSEEEIILLKEFLEPVLEDVNIRVEACRDGKIKGQDNNVRIFSVKHIKGLEFEAVFFINIDKLAKITPLFMKYMYVGATRAATYFGITTASPTLPNEIKCLETCFEKCFKTPSEERLEDVEVNAKQREFADKINKLKQLRELMHKK